MGARFSKFFAIHQAEFVSGLVKVRTYKERGKDNITEYWIYTQKASELIGMDGKAIMLKDEDLKCVIACAGDYITKKDSKILVVEGVKFTNDSLGNELDEYLRKTNRGKNG